MKDKAPIEVEAVLAVGTFLLFSIITLSTLFHAIPAENEKYAFLLIGALIGVLKDTFGRYFQATKGAQDQRKDAAEVASKLADTAAVVAAAAATVPPPGTASVIPGEGVTVEPTAASSLGQASAAEGKS